MEEKKCWCPPGTWHYFIFSINDVESADSRVAKHGDNITSFRTVKNKSGF